MEATDKAFENSHALAVETLGSGSDPSLILEQLTSISECKITLTSSVSKLSTTYKFDVLMTKKVEVPASDEKAEKIE